MPLFWRKMSALIYNFTCEIKIAMAIFGAKFLNESKSHDVSVICQP